MDIYEYVHHLKFSFPLTFSAKTLWVPAHCKISSENFVGARTPRTRRSAPHGVCISIVNLYRYSTDYLQCTCKLTNAVTVHYIFYFTSTSVQFPNPTYPGEFLHINNQKTHNNYKNIILKEPNENSQRAHLGLRAPYWTTLVYNAHTNG